MLVRSDFYILCIAFAICIWIVPGNSITIPSDLDVPKIDAQIQKFVAYGANADSSIKGTNTNSAESRYERSREVHEETYYYQSPKDPIEIKKTLFPSREEGYLVGDPIGVFVEITCKSNDLNELLIEEYLSDSIDLINISRYCYRLVGPNEIRAYKSGSLRDYFENFINNNEKIDWWDKYNIDIGNKCCILNYTKNNTENGADDIDDSMECFLSDCMGLSWAQRCSLNTSIDDNLYICNNANSSEKVKIDFERGKKFAALNYGGLSYKLGVNDDSKSLYLLDNKFNINIANINSNDADLLNRGPRDNYRYVYWYFVKSNKPADFDSTTQVFVKGKNSLDNSDMDKSLTIKVDDPKPNVFLKLNKVRLLRNEKIDIIYEIDFDRLSSINNLNNIKRIEFRQPFDYFEFPNDDNLSFDQNLNKLHNTINKTIIFPNIGEYYLPPIWIDGEPYLFQKEKISVETRFMTYGSFAIFILGILTFLIKDIIFQIDDLKPSPDNKPLGEPVDPKPRPDSKPLGEPSNIELKNKGKKDYLKIIKTALQNHPEVSIVIIIYLIIVLVIIGWFFFDRPIDLLNLP